MAAAPAPDLLYRFQSSVKIGQVERYIITYKPPQRTYHSNDISNANGKNHSSLTKNTTYTAQDQAPLYLKIKNVESLTKRAAYLMGPYILYVDVRSSEYSHKQPCYITADQPQFEPNLQPGQSFIKELSCHTIKDKHVWIVDVVSQMLFSSKTSVSFEVAIGKSKQVVNNSSSGNYNQMGVLDSSSLHVLRMDTKDLWNLPPPISVHNDNDTTSTIHNNNNADTNTKVEPVHLVMLTHGLHSNVGADMLYLKEQIENTAALTGENIIVRGFQDNVCKTERGIKYLGMKVAEYVLNDVYDTVPNIKKISFIAHSLGGLIQTFAVAFIQNNYPWFFKTVSPENFITLASPLLGISHIDSPSYVQAALSFGAIGRTGQELSLIPTEIDGTKTLLELLPTGTTHKVLKKFKRRTVYANAINDGIVPLRTSALLFLDYKGLRKVAEVLKTGQTSGSKSSNTNSTATATNNNSNNNSNRPRLSRLLLEKALSKQVYNAPDFMNSMPFVYASNPIISISDANASGNPDTMIADKQKITDSLKHTQSQVGTDAISDTENPIVNADSDNNNNGISHENENENDSKSASTGAPSSIGAHSSIESRELSIGMIDDPPTGYSDIKSVNSKVGEIPSNKQNKDTDDSNVALKTNNNILSFFSPIQNAIASWVAPQGTRMNNTNDNYNPLPKASVIDSAKSILLPPLPEKQYLIEPNERENPIIHDKIYSDADIRQYKQNNRNMNNRNKRNDINKGKNNNDNNFNQTSNEKKIPLHAEINNESALNPFADSFSNFFAKNSSSVERLEESIAMKWHEGMSWRKVLVNLKPDSHNNIIVRRRFSNAFGWLVLDHLVREHFELSELREAGPVSRLGLEKAKANGKATGKGKEKINQRVPDVEVTETSEENDTALDKLATNEKEKQDDYDSENNKKKVTPNSESGSLSDTSDSIDGNESDYSDDDDDESSISVSDTGDDSFNNEKENDFNNINYDEKGNNEDSLYDLTNLPKHKTLSSNFATTPELNLDLGLEIPKSSHAKQSPKVDRNESFPELDSLLPKDALYGENTAYGYTPRLSNEHRRSLTETRTVAANNGNSNTDNKMAKVQKQQEKKALKELKRKEKKEKAKKQKSEAQDWINSKNYNEDSIFEVGPAGLLSSVNDKISKII